MAALGTHGGNGVFPIGRLGYGSSRPCGRHREGTAYMGSWPRIAGLRVVMSWPADSHFAPPPPPRGRARRQAGRARGGRPDRLRRRAIAIAVLAQQHAPSPAPSAAGTIGPAAAKGPRAAPVAAGVRRHPRDRRPVEPAPPRAQRGRHDRRCPSLTTQANEAAWYKYSVTPGQIGTAVIEGHVDSYQGPAVFFRLGALKPGQSDRRDARRRDHGRLPRHWRAGIRQGQIPGGISSTARLITPRCGSSPAAATSTPRPAITSARSWYSPSLVSSAHP